MPISAPPVSSKLLALIDQFARGSTAVADQSFATAAESRPPCGLFIQESTVDIRGEMRLAVGAWFQSLIDGSIEIATLKALSDAGRRRLHDGTSLASLVQGLRTGLLEMWRILLDATKNDQEVRDETLFSLSPYFYCFVDLISNEITQGYLHEQHLREGWRKTKDEGLAALILNSPADEVSFKHACEALGIDARACRVAVAMDIDMPDGLRSHQESALERLLLTLARHFKVSRNEVVHAIHRGRLVIWLPAARGLSIVCTDRLMREAARALAQIFPQILSVGVGLANRGARGWATSAEEALRALDGGRHGTKGNRWFMYSDIALSACVLQPEGITRYLDALIERLTYESDLLPTLIAYFEHGQHRKLTAGNLGIHPNTLNYRLDRIEVILGADLNDSSWIARLDVAVTLRRLSESTNVDPLMHTAPPLLAASRS